MVPEIFQRWPYLRKQQVHTGDALVLWKTRLRTHFKNARQTLAIVTRWQPKNQYMIRETVFKKCVTNNLKDFVCYGNTKFYGRVS